MLPDLSRLRYKRNLLSDTVIILSTLCKKELSSSFYQMIKKIKIKKGNGTNNNNKCFLHNQKLLQELIFI